MLRLGVRDRHVALPLLLLAQTPQSASADIELQLGDLLMNEARFRDAQEPIAARSRRRPTEPSVRRRAQAGLVLALLRTGDFANAHAEAPRLTDDNPNDAHAQSLMGDTLWALGLFDEAGTPTIPRSRRTRASLALTMDARAA